MCSTSQAFIGYAAWVGRLRDASLNHAGAQHHFIANSGPHALHGLVTAAVASDRRGRTQSNLAIRGLGRAG